MTTDRFDTITYDLSDHIASIGLNRPEHRNQFSVAMFDEFTRAMTEADEDPDVRCVLVHSKAEDFTVGLDVQDVFPSFSAGKTPYGPGVVDPFEVIGKTRTKPLVLAVHGRCYTVGTELALCADICIAADDTRFGLREVRVGIFAAGGSTFRLPQVAGWQRGMRYLLTGDDFDAHEAERLGVATEVVPAGTAVDRARELAAVIASRAPLAVQASLAVAKLGYEHGPMAALRASAAEQQRLFKTADFQEGIASFLERRDPNFKGS
jgi:enoyl-CoA hydratase/carnithine racemase